MSATTFDRRCVVHIVPGLFGPVGGVVGGALFVGRLPDPALVQEYRRSLCLVLPNVYKTSAGETKLLELPGQTLLEGRECGVAALGERRVLRHFTWPGVVSRCLDAYGAVRLGVVA